MLLWVFALLVVACGESISSADRDSSGILACRDFRSLVSDTNAKLLTADEMREKAQKINDRARLSKSPDVVDAANDMLAALTARDNAQLPVAVAAMQQACPPLPV